MSSVPFFETAQLEASFRAALQTALEQESISEVEAAWLGQAQDDTPPASMTVEMVLYAHPLPGATLMINYSNPERLWTYVFDLLQGLRVHDSREAAQIALHSPMRHLGLPASRLEFAALEADVFNQWSGRLTRAQTFRLEQMSSVLGGLPTLRATLNACVDETFKALLPEVKEPHQHRLLIVNSSTGKAIATSSLGKVALQVLSHETEGFGLVRRYLDASGSIQLGEQATAWEQAINDAVKALPAQFGHDLESYWQTIPSDKDRDHRDQIAMSLADDFARALLRAHRMGRVDATQRAWLSDALLGRTDTPPQLCQLTYTRIADSLPVPYAGMLVIRDSENSTGPVYLYSAESGIHHFHDEPSLHRFFLEVAVQNDRPAGIDSSHWLAMQASPPTQVMLMPLGEQPFRALARSITDLVNRNLAKALREPGAQSATAIAAVEDALDIRALVDLRLALLDNRGRWPDRQAKTSTVKLAQPARLVSDLPSRTRQIRAVALRYAGIRDLQPNVALCVEALLAPHLAMISEGTLKPGDIQVQHDGVTNSLMDFFIQRLTGMGLAQMVVGVNLLDARGKPLDWPDANWLIERIDELRETFAHQYKKRLALFEVGSVRLGKGVLDIREETAALYEALLRADLAEARDNGHIPASLLDLLEKVLDLAPPAGLAVRTLYLQIPQNNTRAALSNVFVLSASSDPLSPVLLWNPISGPISYTSASKLRHAIERTLVSAVDLRNWAPLLDPHTAKHLIGHSVTPPSDTSGITVHLEQMDGDLVAQLCRGDRTRRALKNAFDLSNLLAWRSDAVLFQRYMAAQEDPLSNAMRDSLEEQLNKRFNAQLPQWLRTANRHDLAIYQALLERCAQMATPQMSYLHDIPEMEHYAKKALKAALKQDDPDYPDDPDQINITLTHYIGGMTLPSQLPSPIPAATQVVSKTLTEFSLTHFSEFSSAIMTVSVSVPNKKVPDPSYLRDLVTRLDIATPYREVLAEKLSIHSTDHRARRRLFAMGMQPNLLAFACQSCMQGELSPTAAYYVATVLTSPDALARQLVKGVQVHFSQLQLKATDDLPADSVNGMYVIGPTDENQGPLVLYTAYQNKHILQEFKDQADLLHHLHSDERLEKLVIDSVNDDVRVRYDNKGLLSPHIIQASADLYDFGMSYPPVKLLLREITGNAFHYLFEQNVATLLSRAEARTVTRAEAKWKSWRELMQLGLQEATVLIPAELATLVNLWQSIDWLQASAESAKKRKWGEALAQFSTALASLAISRDPNAETALDRTEGAQRTAIANHPTPARPTSLSLASSLLRENSSQRSRQRFEARDVELRKMIYDATEHLFHIPDNAAHYTAVEGKVYEVRQVNEQWYIFQDDERGPQVRLRSDGQWEFYLSLRGGADHGIELESERIDRDVRRIFTIQAQGMTEIYQDHYGHFLQLQVARTLSLHLLSTTLSNLNAWRPWEPLPHKVRAILEQTFGESPSPLVLSRLRDDCKTLLKELLSPSMAAETSKRIVTGYNMPGRDFHMAFTYRGDPHKRIFLSELFFKIPDDVRMNSLARDSDLLAHLQASTLIHELSHSTLKTEDIAYVDAIVPDLSVLEQETMTNRAYYARIKDAWEKGLTAATPAHELFTIQDIGGPRDLRNKDGSAKATILRLTDTSTLDEARAVFHSDAHKRAQVILANADSLALLVTRLGQSASLGAAD